MAHDNDNAGLIRRYLLGELGEDELQQLEEKMMADNELFDRVLLAEDEMVEEYVQGELSESDRAGFEASFLSTPEGRQQVSFAKALSEYASGASASEGHAARERAGEVPARVTEASARASKVSRPVWWSHATVPPYVRLAAAAVIVLGIGLGIWWAFLPRSEVSKGIIALNEAYRDQRPVESRITEFGYAPPPPVSRGREQEKFDYVARDRAQAMIQVEVNEHPSARSYHDLGRLYLTQHEFDKAIVQFEKAVALDEKNAKLQSDYGAALLEKGKAERLKSESGKSLEDFAQSLDHLSKAVELDGSLLEALFNRALALESMSLTIRAEEAWQAYLDRDSMSKWADEAREHLGELRQRNTNKTSYNNDRILQEFTSGFESEDSDKAWRALTCSRNSGGSSIHNKLADDYISAPASGRANLLRLRYVAGLEVARADDLFMSDLVAFYERASPNQLTALAAAHSLMRTAYERFLQSDCAEAINLYLQAEQVFDQTGDHTEATFTRYRLGHCYIRQAERDKARQVFERLHTVCESKKYRWLLAQCEYHLADIKIGLSEYSKALSRSDHALQLFETYDTYGVLVVLVQLADEHRRLNEIQQSFKYLDRGMRLAADDLPDLVPMWGCCIVAAINLNLTGRHRAALECQTEALRLALAMNRPLLVSRSYEYIAVTNSKLGRYGEALDGLQRAFDIGKALSGGSAGVEMMAHSALLLGDTYQQQGDPGQALKAYDQSVELYQKLGFAFYNYDANKGRLRSYVALGDNASAEKEIESVMGLLEEHRSKITAERYRNSFFDIEQNIVDAAIDFKYTNDHAKEAYEYSELCRARSLLALMTTENAASGSMSGTSTTRSLPAIRRHKPGEAQLLPNTSSEMSFASTPLRLLEVQQQMPEEAQLLQYSVLNNKVVAWLVTRHAFQSAVVNVESSELQQEIEQYLSAIKGTSEEQNTRATALAGRLYEILVRPIEPWLDRSREIAIVPDKILNRLPFHALVNPATGEYLLEDFRISYSPSSSAFIINSTIARKKGIPSEEQLLAVGGPRFDRSLLQKFGDLKSARREADQSARYYKDPWVLVDDAPREGRVKSLIERSDVVLIATHYDSNARSSDDSRLLLAEEPKQSAQAGTADGVLTAAEVLNLDLRRPRLVVLAACGTGVEQVFAGEGAISMARPFIAKGVPLVVACLWAVNSDATADLMIRFHRYRKVDRLSTASAIRQAQLYAIHGQDTRYRLPYYWAAFVTMGGYAEF